jgi:aryl-alcohol dehydrogenase-like predicted oxidoreductase
VLTRPFGPTGVAVSVIGQGTWHMGEDRRLKKDEIAALRLGIELGLTHIDTAEMYADGQAEGIVADAVAGQRDRVFIATKVLPSNASYKGALDFTLTAQDLSAIDAEHRR